MTFSLIDRQMMDLAIQEALVSYSKNEVPIGAVLTRDNEILSKGHNLSIGMSDPTAHAEIVAIRNACHETGNYRLIGATLYTTLEPCLMCFGAIINARVKKLVIGALDNENGAPISNVSLLKKLNLNHKLEIETGLYSKKCSELLKNFFKDKRVK